MAKSQVTDNLNDMQEIEIDGIKLPVESPATVPAFAARVEELTRAGQAIYPVGGLTGLDFGNPPSKAGVALSLANLNRVIDYPIRDLTITVEAGLVVGEVQRLLAAQNQRLPVDVADADRATIGGAVSVNTFGPRRLSSGTFRDHVIGITVVNEHGELCAAGGRVVKNVAGYDLAKLYTGAMGTLGVIVQLTLKLQPVPPASAWVATGITSDQIGATLDMIHKSATRPAAVELLNRSATEFVQNNLPATDFVLAVLFEDNAGAVEWQINQLGGELGQTLVQISNAADFERRLIDSPAVLNCPFSILATTRPGAVAAMMVALNNNEATALHAHAMNGIFRIGMNTTDQTTAREVHRQAMALANSAGGNAVMRRCPMEWKGAFDIWGGQPPSMRMMRDVKRHFDPRELLNPNRRNW